MIVSLLCLIGGYVAVSWTLDRTRAAGKSDPPTPDPGLGAGASAGANQRNQARGDPPRPPPQTAMPWYVVLDVDRSASRAEITAAYRSRISQYHPDKVARMGPEIRALAEKKSAEINAAYETAIKGVGVI